MTASEVQEIQTLARCHGVKTSYIDMNGSPRDAAPEVLVAVLNALGVAANNRQAVRDSLRDAEAQSHRQCIEPVLVAWDQRPFELQWHLSGRDVSRPVRCRLRLENGETRAVAPGSIGVETRTRRRARRFHSQRGSLKRIRLPGVPFGYHTLEVDFGNRHCEALVISAPAKGYTVRGLRDWGFFLPVYATHSRRSWGAGNLSDWRDLIGLVASAGGSVAAALPLLASFLDFPVCDPSPYSPVSRLFWNEFFIDLTAVPEFQSCTEARTLAESSGFRNRLGAFRCQRLIDYRAEWSIRRKILETLARYFFKRVSIRRAEFENYLRDRPEAEDYACFRATCDRRRTSWRTWPHRQRDGVLAKGDFSDDSRRVHLYAQWIAYEQVRQLIADSRREGVNLYLDLPLGVHPDGYDVWRERANYALEASVGAPPDAFFTKGQDWGFPPLHPERVRESGYRHVLDYLRFHMRHAGLLRIDHVMTLHRLYWIPKGSGRSQGAYVGYRAEEWHALLSLESHRHRTLLAGENLGTVPPEVNAALRRHRVGETYVVQYEQRADARRALREPPVLSVASLNTHDMPTFAGHWSGIDLADRAKLGLIPKRALPQKRKERHRLNAALVKFLRTKGFLKLKKPGAESVRDACLRWLAEGPAEIVLVNLEDLWLEPLPQNVPGTVDERPNWRRKARLALEQLKKDPRVWKSLQSIAHGRRPARTRPSSRH